MSTVNINTKRGQFLKSLFKKPNYINNSLVNNIELSLSLYNRDDAHNQLIKIAKQLESITVKQLIAIHDWIDNNLF